MPRDIRMKHGGFEGIRRQDGRVWPAFNEVITVGDEEAAQLTSSGTAVYVADEPEPRSSGFRELRKISDNYDPVLDTENRREKREEEVSAPVDTDSYPEDQRGSVKRPATNAPKDDWINYAVSRGEKNDVAERMTKADLISRYGASL